MYQTYKPSGKVSWLFFPLLLLFLLLFMPSVSFIYIFILWHCPSIIANGILYLLAVYLLALFGNRVCIRGGKVRNLKVAGFYGVLAGISFLYMLLACYYQFTAGNFSPGRLPELLAHPGNLLEAWKGMAGEGFLITTLKGTPLFTLKGGFFTAAVVILLLLTVLVLVVVYVDAAWFPFCEASKKWAASRTIYLEYIEDKDTFIKKLSFGDTAPLKELDVLQGINCSHSEAELYITEGNSDFYITIENKKKKEGETGADGEVKYEEEELMELLKLDRQTGEILLSKASFGPEQASAAVVTEASGKHTAFIYVRMVLAASIQLCLLVLSWKGADLMQELISNGLIWYYMIITLLAFTLGLIGCFVKEDVMIKDEGQLYFNETRRSQVERQSSPLVFKVYYGIMVITSILILSFCVWRYL